MKQLGSITIKATNGSITAQVVTISDEGVALDVQAHINGYGAGSFHRVELVPIEATAAELAVSVGTIDSSYIWDALASIERAALGKMRQAAQAAQALRSQALTAIAREFGKCSRECPCYNVL